MKNISRRNILGIGLGAAGTMVAKTAIAATCGGLTPAQTEGPFYPISDQADKDNDLTVVRGAAAVATGQIIYLRGRVLNQDCQPIENALVEIWQAAHTGKYNHPADPNPAQLDPNFQYWGRDVSAADGAYIFKTILPGEYQASANWRRPPHIHMKVHRRGFQELTTQVYFAGHRLNSADRVLQGVPKKERDNVVVDFKAANISGEDVLVGNFDILLSDV